MRKFHLLLVAIVIFLNGCEFFITEGYDPLIQKYPAKVGHEWEYHTTWKFEYYDSTGRIDSTSILDLGRTIVRVIKENEVVGGYSNLICFESFDVLTSNNIHKMWYLNSDSGFYAIAYQNPGVSQPITPKQVLKNIEQIKLFIKSIGILPGVFNPFSSTSDSIQYYSPERKVLQYPMMVGSKWVELVQPFYRERFINRKQIVNLNGNIYDCFKVESEMSMYNLVMNDYINPNSGLIVREIISDSLALINPGSPDPIGYFKSTTTSTLVREILNQ